MTKRRPFSERMRTEVRAKVRASDQRVWQIAKSVGLHPAVLSSLLSGARDAVVDDPRIARLAELVGVPLAEAFAEDERTGVTSGAA